MSDMISLRKYEVEDFVSVDSGTEEVTVTVFNGRMQVGAQGWASVFRMSPAQAEELAGVLRRHAKKVADAWEVRR